METQGALSFSELVLNASFLVQCVMLFLLALSVISWTIIISRNNQYRIGRAKADEFEDRFWSGIDLNNLYQECMKRPDELVGLEVIYSAGFKEFVRLVNSGPADQDVVMDGTYRQMKVACSREVELLENHLPTLATIGSISPYIGLFGTVWGIMHAFVALAAVKNATLAMVAPPIAEALIATAMGLFAAIPAVMFYNRFVTKVEALENRYYNFMDEFSTILNRRLVTIRSQINRTQPSSPTNAAASAAPMAAAPLGAGANVPNAMSNAMSNAMPNAMANAQPNSITGALPGAQPGMMPGAQSGMMAGAQSGMMPGNLPGNMSGNMASTSATTMAAMGPMPLSSFSAEPSSGSVSATNAARNRFTPHRVQVDMNSSQAQDMAKAMHSPLAPEEGVEGGAEALRGKPAVVLGGNASIPAASSNNAPRGPLGTRTNPLSGSSTSKRPGLSTADSVLGGSGLMSQESMRGVVPPRTGNLPLTNAQLPGGAASAVKPSAMPLPGMDGVELNNAASENSIYRAGFERRQAAPKSDDEPHYITPGGQKQRRNSGSGANKS